MRTSFFTLLSASALALSGIASSANAASTVTGVTPAVLTPPASAIFGAVVDGTVGAPTAIDDVFSFTISGGPGLTNGQVTTLLLNGANNITFSSITLDGLYSFVKTSNDPGPETWTLDPVTLADGKHSIEVIGTLHDVTGSYAGTLNVQAVPEPATWAMMLLGFGAIGLTVRGRRRRQTPLEQLA
jgi:hypothetical protein